MKQNVEITPSIFFDRLTEVYRVYDETRNLLGSYPSYGEAADALARYALTLEPIPDEVLKLVDEFEQVDEFAGFPEEYHPEDYGDEYVDEIVPAPKFTRALTIDTSWTVPVLAAHLGDFVEEVINVWDEE